LQNGWNEIPNIITRRANKGIDVNAKNEMYKLMQNLPAKNGIIMVSSELTEILTISNRYW
jgi:ABC-type sugar transport system ATPase subunit